MALTACSPAGRRPAEASWFQLQSGTFAPVPGLSAAVAVPSRPWTVQSRVADMAFLGDTLYCAVNGSGLATLAVDAKGAAAFTYHADPLIFAHRTITTLIPRQGTLAVHLYYNALLNDVPQQDLSISGISLVTYLPSQDDFSFLIPPFQKKNPDWEAVGIAPLSEDSFDFEWKYTDTAQTRFAYTRFHADTSREESANREAYLAALGTPYDLGHRCALRPRGLLRRLPGADERHSKRGLAAVLPAVEGKPGAPELSLGAGERIGRRVSRLREPRGCAWPCSRGALLPQRRGPSRAHLLPAGAAEGLPLHGPGEGGKLAGGALGRGLVH